MHFTTALNTTRDGHCDACTKQSNNSYIHHNTKPMVTSDKEVKKWPARSIIVHYKG